MLGQSAPISLALGQLGSTFIADTSAHTGSWGRIYCVTACAFTILTSGTLPGNGATCMLGTLSSITLAAGQEIQGIFTAITLASGAVIAYNI